MRWIPVAFLNNCVFIVTHGGVELTTPVLQLHTANHYTTAHMSGIQASGASRNMGIDEALIFS